MLLELPSELFNCILEYIGYLDAIQLSRASKQLHASVNPQAWPTEDREHDVSLAESFDQHNLAVQIDRSTRRQQTIFQKTDGHACFSCFKVKEAKEFSQNQITRRYAKPDCMSRFCIDCGLVRDKYQPRTTLKVIAERRWTTSRHSCEKSESLTDLLLCIHCNSFSEYVQVGPPQICVGCEDIQTDIDKSEAGRAVLDTRNRGCKTVECMNCKGLNEMAFGQDFLQCEGCDESICKKCFGLGWKYCYREGPEYEDDQMLFSLRGIFGSCDRTSTSAAGGDLLDGDEDEVLESLKLHG